MGGLYARFFFFCAILRTSVAAPAVHAHLQETVARALEPKFQGRGVRVFLWKNNSKKHRKKV